MTEESMLGKLKQIGIQIQVLDRYKSTGVVLTEIEVIDEPVHLYDNVIVYKAVCRDKITDGLYENKDMEYDPDVVHKDDILAFDTILVQMMDGSYREYSILFNGVTLSGYESCRLVGYGVVENGSLNYYISDINTGISTQNIFRELYIRRKFYEELSVGPEWTSIISHMVNVAESKPWFSFIVDFSERLIDLLPVKLSDMIKTALRATNNITSYIYTFIKTLCTFTVDTMHQAYIKIRAGLATGVII